MEDRSNRYHTININTIQLSQIIQNLAIILYKPSQVHQVDQIIGDKIQDSVQVRFIFHNNNYWLLKSYTDDSRADLQQLQRLISLNATVICIQLSNYLEALVEKMFCNLYNSLSCKNQIKLIFIKSIYHNKPHTNEIKYCEKVGDSLQIINDGKTLSTKPYKVVDMLQMYDCDEIQNVPKVKVIYHRYEDISKLQQDIIDANDLIFAENKSLGQVVKNIQGMKLPLQDTNKLKWKSQQMSRYRQWLEQQKQASSIKCSNYTFRQLDNRINFITITAHRKEWIANSFLVLKKKFNKIGGLNDNIAIEDFKSEYQLMRNQLDKLQTEVEESSFCFAVAGMKAQLQDFYSYHQDLLEGSTFSSLIFIKKQARYLWRFNNTIYKKIAAFLLLGTLACCQDNLIRGFTILTLALITLSLRC